MCATTYLRETYIVGRGLRVTTQEYYCSGYEVTTEIHRATKALERTGTLVREIWHDRAAGEEALDALHDGIVRHLRAGDPALEAVG